MAYGIGLRRFLISGSLAVALCVCGSVAGASAASSARLSFSPGTGAVLPTHGGVTQVGVACAGEKANRCRGRVSLVPSGRTAKELGTGAIAGDNFRLAAGASAELRLRLDQTARRALSDGPLKVTAVLEAAGSEKPVARRRATIVRPRGFSPPPQAPTVTPVLGSNDVEFSWDWTIPGGHYLVLDTFRCPGYAPRVARTSRQIGLVSAYEAKVEVKAADDVGYSGFSHVDTSGSTFNVQGPYNSQVKFTNMAGWPEGGFFYNSIWAPPLDDRTFSLKVTCTDAAPENSARVQAFSGGKDYRNFLPWYFNQNPL